LAHAAAIRSFSRLCEGQTGGFSKTPDASPDPLHTYMALSGFALTSSLLERAEREVQDKGSGDGVEGGGGGLERSTKELCAALGLSRAAAHGFAP